METVGDVACRGVDNQIDAIDFVEFGDLCAELEDNVFLKFLIDPHLKFGDR